LNTRQATILIIDNTPNDICNLLENEYKIKIAKDEDSVIHILNSSIKIDLILLSTKLPDISGYEICKKLKNSDISKHIPIIFITDKSNKEEEKLGLSIGAIDYITKHYNKAIIKLKLKNHLEYKLRTDMIEKLSVHDTLTGIKNRRFFNERFNEMFNEAKRDKISIAIMMIDIDCFKLYNDNYGHCKGDEALKKVAKALEKSLKRPTDLVARYGGEEFIVLLKNIDKEGLIIVANNTLQAVRNLNISHMFSEVSNILTISIGISHYISGQNITKQELLVNADKVLYEVKNIKKNSFAITEF